MGDVINVDKDGNPLFTNDKDIHVTRNKTVNINLNENKEVIFRNPKSPPKRTEIKNPLTPEHRKQIKDTIDELVRISNVIAKKSINHAAAYTKLYEQGLQGEVNHISQIEEEEFEQCLSYLKQQIRILESYDKHGVIRGVTSEWRNNRIKAIHARCKELKVADERRKNYMAERFKKDSLIGFTDDEIDEFYRYVMSRNPKFECSSKMIEDKFSQRQTVVARLSGMFEAEAKAKGKVFNPMKLPFEFQYVLERLNELDSKLFDFGDSTIKGFWAKQKILKCGPGKKSGDWA